MTALLLPALLAFAFLAACHGWGTLLDRSRPSSATGVEPVALGLAALLFLGGVLNLVSAVRPPVVIMLLAVGAALSAARFATSSEFPALRYLLSIARTRPGAVILVLTAALVALRLLSASVSRSFSPYDDFTAYFVFPTKMVETGSLGVDPFSARRSLSALGGTYFLDAVVLTFFDHRSLNLMDKGVGLLLLLGSLIGFLRERRCPPVLAALPLVLLAGVPLLRSNVTSLLLSSALFVALFRRLAAQGSPTPPIAEILRLALLGAGLCTLKSTMIPFAVLLPGFWLVQSLPSAPWATLRSGALLAGAAALFLLPWMLSMHASAGTLLYPLLGRGNYGFPPVESLSLPAVAATTAVGLATLALVVPFLGLSRRTGDPESFRRAGTAALGAAGLGTIVLVAGTTGMGFLRQPFPVLFALALLVVATSLARLREEPEPAWRRGLVTVIAFVCFAAFAGTIHRHRLYTVWPRDIAFALSGSLLEPAGALQQIRTLQETVPPGSPILAFVPRPYLFDFRRNPVFIADYPGTFAPPPGLPLYDGPERLRAYLLEQGIAHVAFTLEPHPKLETEEQYPWMELAFRHQRAFEEAIRVLARRCPKPFEAGATIVLSLGGCAAAQTRLRDRADDERRSPDKQRASGLEGAPRRLGLPSLDDGRARRGKTRRRWKGRSVRTVGRGRGAGDSGNAACPGSSHGEMLSSMERIGEESVSTV